MHTLYRDQPCYSSYYIVRQPLSDVTGRVGPLSSVVGRQQTPLTDSEPREGISVSTETDTRKAAPSGAKPFLTFSEAAQYLRDMGFTKVTERTIRYHTYETGLLPKPKMVTGRGYVHRADLDKLVESL